MALDYGSEQIAQYEYRENIPVISPAAQVTPEFGPYGIPYQTQMLGWQTCRQIYISAPPPGQKSIITHAAVQYTNAGQTPIGAAPTSGVYTGVHEDGCT